MIDDKDIEKLGEIFATKDDMKEMRDEIVEFKNEILTGQDDILGKLDALLQEKTVEDEQDKRQKKVLEIHNNALKRNKILSEEEISNIHQQRVF